MTVVGGVGKFRKPRVSNGVAGIKHSSAHYIGRPETIESVFYMYRITGDRKWQVSLSVQLDGETGTDEFATAGSRMEDVHRLG